MSWMKQYIDDVYLLTGRDADPEEVTEDIASQMMERGFISKCKECGRFLGFHNSGCKKGIKKEDK